MRVGDAAAFSAAKARKPSDSIAGSAIRELAVRRKARRETGFGAWDMKCGCFEGELVQKCKRMWTGASILGEDKAGLGNPFVCKQKGARGEPYFGCKTSDAASVLSRLTPTEAN